MEHPPKQGLKQKKQFCSAAKKLVLMEHPPKQGLKLLRLLLIAKFSQVLMEHPPKQGLKQVACEVASADIRVLMEHPPKQGLKPSQIFSSSGSPFGFNGTSTKTRIETCEYNKQATCHIEF